VASNLAPDEASIAVTLRPTTGALPSVETMPAIVPLVGGLPLLPTTGPGWQAVSESTASASAMCSLVMGGRLHHPPPAPRGAPSRVGSDPMPGKVHYLSARPCQVGNIVQRRSARRRGDDLIGPEPRRVIVDVRHHDHFVGRHPLDERAQAVADGAGGTDDRDRRRALET